MTLTRRNLSLPLARHAQLTELKEQLGHETYSQTIGDLIIAFRDRAKVKHTIPNIELRRCADGLVLTYFGVHIGMSFERARAIADAIRATLAERGKGTALYMSGTDKNHYLIKVQGRGVTVAISDVAHIMSRDVAAEFAGLLEREARPRA